VVSDEFTIDTLWIINVYAVGSTTFDIPTKGTAVFIAPPTAVTDMKLVGGFKYHGLFAVPGCNTKVNTYIFCGVVGIFVKPKLVNTVAVVDKE
jgi:hypothetical protein